MNGKAKMIKVERPLQTLREMALDKLRDAIIAGYFPPGHRLVERDLCEQLGVSRTIVREVLRHLESEGLVDTLPNRGPIVAVLDIEEAKQIYEIRGALEGMAARLCAERRDTSIADLLDRALEDIRRSYQNDDFSGVLAHTTTFYQVLFKSVEREVAWGVVNSLTVRINHLRSMTIKTRQRDSSGPAEMQMIALAIRQGDANAAYDAAISHVVSASRIAEAVLTEQRMAATSG
jgi:GntR family transcriptional regulator, trigonelline degradation regulator